MAKRRRNSIGQFISSLSVEQKAPSFSSNFCQRIVAISMALFFFLLLSPCFTLAVKPKNCNMINLNFKLVKLVPKVKISNKDTDIAIKMNFQAGMKLKDIASLFGVSKQKVNYWIHHSTNKRKTRKTKLNRNEKNLIFKWAKDKPISYL